MPLGAPVVVGLTGTGTAAGDVDADLAGTVAGKAEEVMLDDLLDGEDSDARRPVPGIPSTPVEKSLHRERRSGEDTRMGSSFAGGRSPAPMRELVSCLKP